MKPEHGVAEELEPLVESLDAVLDRRGVREREPEQLSVGEGAAEDLLGERHAGLVIALDGLEARLRGIDGPYGFARMSVAL